jgi:hypothetical protein
MSTTIRNQKLFCLNCGAEYSLNFPISPKDFSKKTKAFDTLHKDCKKTWQEPQADQSKSLQERALWWIANGETGSSSKTMWNCFMGAANFEINHPYDPDDFKRCYKLLKAVPEWNTHLYKLKPLSRQWSNLVDNWDKLTEMYELNEKEGWKNYKEIRMYEFMQTLIK